MSNLTTIAKTISQAAYMRRHGQKCADQYLAQVAEYGVDYATAYELMRAAAHCDSLEEFEAVVAANAYAEGTEDTYVPTPDENAAKDREYLAYARERFGHAFYIEPNGYGIRAQCKGCGQSATGQFANTMLYEHICFQ